MVGYLFLMPGKTEDGERAKRKRSAMSVTEDNGVDNSNGKYSFGLIAGRKSNHIWQKEMSGLVTSYQIMATHPRVQPNQ